MTDELPSDDVLDAAVSAAVAAAPPPPAAPVVPPAPVVESPVTPPADGSAPEAPVTPPADGVVDPNAPPAAPVVEDENEPGDFGLPKRHYTKHMKPEQKALLAAMFKNPDATPEEALVIANRLLGREAAPAGTTEGTPPADAPEAPLDPLEAAEAELARLDSELDEAAGADGIGSVFNREIKEKIARQSELRAELALMRRDAQGARQTEAQEIARLDQEATETAQQRYPDLANDSSPMVQRAAQRIGELKALQVAAARDPKLAQHPDVQLKLAQFAHPNFAMILADEVAGELGISPVVQAKPNGANGNTVNTTSTTQGHTPAANGTPTQAQPGMVPVSGGAGASHRVNIVQSDPMSRMMAAARQAAPDDLDAADKMLDEFFTSGAGEENSRRVVIR